jgi:hypothetical protein
MLLSGSRRLLTAVMTGGRVAMVVMAAARGDVLGDLGSLVGRCSAAHRRAPFGRAAVSMVVGDKFAARRARGPALDSH